MDLVARELYAAIQKAAPAVQWQFIRPGRDKDNWVERQSLRYLRYPRLLRRIMKTERPSILHVLDHSYAHLCKTYPRAVVTCYDLANFRVTDLNPIQLSLWKARVKGMHRAARIVAISEHTAHDIHDMLGIPRERIVVSYLGVAKRFRPLLEGRPQAGRIADRLREASGSFFFLHVGSNEYRKNVPVLLTGFARARQRSPRSDLKLVKVGRSLVDDGLETLLRDLNIIDHVIQMPRVTEEELVEIYNSVDCLALPSLYEGFGLPVVEAQACGLPCILANASCLKEVGGAGALYHECADPDDLANRMVELAANPALKERLSAVGRENAMRFSWDTHARSLLDVYNEVLNADVPPRPAVS